MKIEMTRKWLRPKSTNTDPTYYESIYTVTGSLSEVKHFQQYVANYKATEQAGARDCSGEAPRNP